MRSLMDSIKAARRVSVPVLAIGTADQYAAVESIAKAMNGDAPKFVWDVVRGVRALNKPAEEHMGKVDVLVQKQLKDPVVMLDWCQTLPGADKRDATTYGSVIFMLNAHRFLPVVGVVQAIQNVRDTFKLDRRMLALMGTDFKLPAELTHDVQLLEEPLPGEDVLGQILDEVYDSAGLKPPKGDERAQAVDAGRGIPAFAWENVVAMSLTSKGLDMDAAWERKRAAVNQTPGLSITRSGPTFEDMRGNAAAIEFGQRLFNGEEPPRCIAVIDEIEKMWAGAQGGDLSGVSADQLGVWLRTMEDEGWDGMILVGPPGAAKTLYSRALGTSFGRPTLAVDMGAAKGSLVGQSEGMIRQMVRGIKGVGGSRVFVIATCNKLDVLPPELRRRFRSGIWFFDVPTADERESIWQLYLKKYKLGDVARKDRPSDDGWTGAEIRNCCDLASRLRVTVAEAAAYVVPVSKANPQSLQGLREAAHGRFLSATRPGVYLDPARTVEQPVAGTGRRRMEV